MTGIRIAAAGLLLAVLAACGERDIILPGERKDIRDTVPFENEARPISFAAATSNADWTHRNGGPDHQISHPALPRELAQVFAADIGSGDSRRARITSDPVVSGGVIYTIDARAQVTATGTDGTTRWVRDLTPRTENGSDASGGGIAVADTRVFVTTGFGALTALDAQDGSVLWQQDLDAPGGSAPTVVGDLVFVAARDSTAWAVEVENGRIRYQLTGTPSVGNFGGGAGAAATSDLVVFPFSSGEVIGAFPQGGVQRWSTVVSGARLGAVAANISDIAGDPVIDGDRVYVGNFAGQVVALSLASGERIWTATEGAVSPVWPAGGSVFLINDLNELVRLDDADGSVIWRVQLPQFTETRIRQRRTVFAHYGPVLAGGLLVVASSDGQVRRFDPASGELRDSLPIPGGAASNPVVAGNSLYVLSKDGQLVAFR